LRYIRADLVISDLFEKEFIRSEMKTDEIIDIFNCDYDLQTTI